MCLPMWAYWRPSPQSKRQIDRFSRSCTVMQKVPILTMGFYFPKNSPFRWGYLDLHLIHSSLGSPESAAETACRSVQPFLHRRLESVPILYNGTPLPPLKWSLSMGDLDFHLKHGFLGPPETSTQTASRSVQPFLQG